MVAPRHRSRSKAKVFRKTPGKRVSVQYKDRKPSVGVCGTCKTQLKGIPRARASKMANIPKSKKRPERPFGGVLCSSCLRRQVITSSRT